MHRDLDQYKILLLRLWLTNGAGPVFAKKLFSTVFDPSDNFKQPAKVFDPLKFESLCAQTLGKLAQIVPSEIVRVQQTLTSLQALEEELERVERSKARLITILDEDYPDLLRQIYAPPTVLMVKGSLPVSWEPSIAIVGSRNASSYAARSLDIILPKLIKAGFATVSGGAVGVDSMVHQKTLDLSGKTVVVLGSGFNKLYPACNQRLFEQTVAQGGAVISAFSVNTDASKGSFPARNRIVSGLTPACLVVQAAEKSGALITASFALEQNREVFAIPGLIDDASFLGNNKLLKQGAGLVTTAADIFETLGFINLVGTAQSDNFVDLSIEENSILQLMHHPIGIEELAEFCGLEMGMLQEQLFELQLLGKVRQNFSGTWQKN
jgi:DNA processing protein